MKQIDLELGNGEAIWGNVESPLRNSATAIKMTNLETWKFFLPHHVGEAIQSLMKLTDNCFARGYVSPSGQEALQAAIKLAWKIKKKAKTTIYTFTRARKDSTAFGDLLLNHSKGRSGTIPFSINHQRLDLDSATIKLEDKSTLKDSILVIDPFRLKEELNWEISKFSEFYKLASSVNALVIFDLSQYSLGIEYHPLFAKEFNHSDFLVFGKGLGGGLASAGAYLLRKKLFERAYGKDPLEHTNTFHGLYEESEFIRMSCELLQSAKTMDQWKVNLHSLTCKIDALREVSHKWNLQILQRGLSIQFIADLETMESVRSVLIQHNIRSLRSHSGISVLFPVSHSEDLQSEIIERLNTALSLPESRDFSINPRPDTSPR